MIKPNPSLRKLFQDIDRTKARVWGLTNAYRPVRYRFSSASWHTEYHVQHAERVLRILNLDDQLDGLVFCDYNSPDHAFVAKPEHDFYRQVRTSCLFVWPDA